MLQLNGDGKTLRVVEFREFYEVDVDVSGLDVDIDCASYYNYDPSRVRVQLLSTGCAELAADFANADEVQAREEQQAQESAMEGGRGRWSPSSNESLPVEQPTSESSPGGWLSSVWPPMKKAWSSSLDWIKSNMVTALGLLVGIISIPWIVRWIDRVRTRRFEKEIHIVLVGAPGAGKTGLWTAWKEDSAPKSIAPTVGFKRSGRLESVRYGEYKLHPYVTDMAGSEPWHLENQSRAVPRRAKRVLVLVVAPRAQNEAAGGSVFDSNYIAKQEGYMHLPRAFLGRNGTRARPDLVVMFATKFDLLSDVGPSDSNGVNARKRVESEFRTHRLLVEDLCEKNGTPFVWIVGSATNGWGIGNLRESIRKVVMK